MFFMHFLTFFVQVIANLTHAIEKQKDRIELMKKFTKWRLQHFLCKQKAREEVYMDLLMLIKIFFKIPFEKLYFKKTDQINSSM